MCEKKIGGSYGCRICGGMHSCFPCNQEALPLQAVQISIENIEEFFEKSSMSVEIRKIFEGSFKELRKLFKVPEEKIYNRPHLLGEEELAEAFEELSPVERDKKEETEETKDKTVRFNPTSEVLEKASAIISRVCDFAVNNVYVTKLQEEPMMTAISSLKNEVLKK